MAEPICKISDIIFIRFELADLAAQKEYLQHFGMQVAHETSDSLYFKGVGIDPYIYVATQGKENKENKYISAAYRVDHFEALEKLSAAFAVDIIASDEPVGGHKVELTDPDNMRVEVFHGQTANAADTRSSPLLNTGFKKTRQNELQRFGKGAQEWIKNEGRLVYNLPSKVMRLGHTAINVSNAAKSIAWYQNTLGLLISDNIVMPDGHVLGAFMRCDLGSTPADHHTINIVELPPVMDNFHGTFGHAGFEVSESFDDLMAGHFHLKTRAQNVHEWGIGRHLLGSQIYDYWRDPNGFILEHWTDGDLLDNAQPANDVPVKDVVLAQYGPLVPSSFNLSVPLEALDEIRKNIPSLVDQLPEN